jgi:hypothetical protein
VPGAQEVARADDPVQPPVDDGLRDQEAPRPPEVPLDGTTAGEATAAKVWARALAALWHDAPGLPVAGTFPLGPTTSAAAEPGLTLPEAAGAGPARAPKASAPFRQVPATEVVAVAAAAAPPAADTAEAIPEFAPAAALAPGREERPLPAESGESPPVYAAALAAAGLVAWPANWNRPAEPANIPRPSGRRASPGRKGRPAP